MPAIIAFFMSPIGIMVACIIVALLAQFFWEGLKFILEVALIVAIVGVVIAGLGGFSGYGLGGGHVAPVRMAHRLERI